MKKYIKFFILMFVFFNSSYICSAQKESVNDIVTINTTDTKLSPNNDGVFDSIDFEISFLQDKIKVKEWNLSIINTQTDVVFDKFSGQKEIPKKINWKGENKSGQIGEGTYRYVFTATINKKNIKIEKGIISVDKTPPYISLSASEDTILADKENNKFSKTMAFVLNVGDENTIDKSKTKLEIVNYANKVVKTWSFEKQDEIPQSVFWDGKDDVYGLVVPVGEYKARLTAYDELNNGEAMTVGFSVLEYTEPKIDVSEIVVKEEPRGLVVNLSSNVLFSSSKSVLKKEATASLNETITVLNAYPANKVLIEGYTDSTGDTKKNLQLSYDRAQAVYSYFVQNGIPAERLNVVGYGEENPIASNKTAKGRAKNRRVNIIILKSSQDEN